MGGIPACLYPEWEVYPPVYTWVVVPPAIPRVVVPPAIPRVVGIPPYMPPPCTLGGIYASLPAPRVYMDPVYTPNTVMFEHGDDSYFRPINEESLRP